MARKYDREKDRAPRANAIVRWSSDISHTNRASVEHHDLKVGQGAATKTRQVRE